LEFLEIIKMIEKILIINICKEKLHYCEFVKPVEDIVVSLKLKYFTKHYKELNKKDLEESDKIIICGTSLKDNEFLENINKFKWLMNFKKPVIGICGGMEIIGAVFGGKLKKKTEESKGFLKKKTEIGFYKEAFKKKFLGFKEGEVYHLHNYYVEFDKRFEILSSNKVVQAVKHKKKEIYGLLFHPEVRNKEIIKNFVRNIY